MPDADGDDDADDDGDDDAERDDEGDDDRLAVAVAAAVEVSDPPTEAEADPVGVGDTVCEELRAVVCVEDDDTVLAAV